MNPEEKGRAIRGAGGRKGNRRGDGFSFGEERGELREFLASCSSSVAISD